jgi:ketosteroid isomerase-like protein
VIRFDTGDVQGKTDEPEEGTMNSNTDTVMAMYAAFGRGDVEFILDQMGDDVRWDHGVRDTGLTYVQPGTGKQHVANFFSALVSQIEFTTFEPQTPCAGGDTVMVAVREVARNIRTGNEIPEDLAVHIWTFGPDGKVASFRHVADWSTHESAAQAVPATSPAN